MRTLAVAGALLLATASTPVLAQATYAGPGAASPRAMPFAGMSQAGRRAVIGAMRSDPADRDRVRTTRDRMLDLLSAERLDTGALRRAMDDERDAATAMHTRRQGALLQALQGLSVADRRAFVADARSIRGRFEGRRGMLRERLRGRGGLDDGQF